MGATIIASTLREIMSSIFATCFVGSQLASVKMNSLISGVRAASDLVSAAI